VAIHLSTPLLNKREGAARVGERPHLLVRYGSRDR